MALLGHGGPPAQQDSGGDTSDLVKQAVDLIHQAVGNEPDPTDAHLLTKVLTLLQQYLSDEQKMHDQAMGGGDTMRMLRKAG